LLIAFRFMSVSISRDRQTLKHWQTISMLNDLCRFSVSPMSDFVTANVSHRSAIDGQRLKVAAGFLSPFRNVNVSSLVSEKCDVFPVKWPAIDDSSHQDKPVYGLTWRRTNKQPRRLTLDQYSSQFWSHTRNEFLRDWSFWELNNLLSAISWLIWHRHLLVDEASGIRSV
jgi:hypothetical protein